jgi:hypothetical protein
MDRTEWVPVMREANVKQKGYSSSRRRRRRERRGSGGRIRRIKEKVSSVCKNLTCTRKA